jgi:hypothetical protein
MSKPIVVNVPFSDVAQLARGFVDRVSSESIVLPSAEPVPQGQWTQFSVLLRDGTVAFAGIGRSARTADRGPQAPAPARYDVLIDSLRFEEASMRVFEHLVLVSQSVLQGESKPQENAVGPEWRTADVTDDEVEQVASHSTPAVAAAARINASAAVAASKEPIQAENNPYVSSVLKRPVLVRAWQPEEKPAVSAPHSSAHFNYPSGSLPRPARPPRPDLDPSLKVTPAPKPVASLRPAPVPVDQERASEEKKAAAPSFTAAEASVIKASSSIAHSSAQTADQAYDRKVVIDQIEADDRTPIESSIPPSLTPSAPSVESRETPIEPLLGKTAEPFPPERITAKIRNEKLNDLLASDRPPKGRRRRTSKHPKR